MLNDILTALAAVALLGLLLGILLAVFIRYFGIEEDKKVKKMIFYIKKQRQNLYPATVPIPLKINYLQAYPSFFLL